MCCDVRSSQPRTLPNVVTRRFGSSVVPGQWLHFIATHTPGLSCPLVFIRLYIHMHISLTLSFSAPPLVGSVCETLGVTGNPLIFHILSGVDSRCMAVANQAPCS